MAHSISLALKQSRRGIPNEAFWAKHSGWVSRMGLSGWSIPNRGIPEGYTEWIILNFSISNYSMIQYGKFR